MTHFEAVEVIAKRLTNELVVTNLGYTALELYHLNDRKLNLYAIQMSLGTPLAFGLARAIPSRKAIAIDGDGSLLMGLGVLATIGTHPTKNLLVIVLDNGCYAATGWHPTATGRGSDLAGIATAAGIKNVRTADSPDALNAALDDFLRKEEAAFIRAKVELGPITKLLDQLPFDRLEGVYQFRRALVDNGGSLGYTGHHGR